MFLQSVLNYVMFMIVGIGHCVCDDQTSCYPVRSYDTRPARKTDTTGL